MKPNRIRSRKADSLVISTVILVSVTIVLAFAVAYWIRGVTDLYSKFGKVEMQSVVCTWDSNATCWKITLRLKNAGTAQATLTGVFINEMEVAAYDLDSVIEGYTSTNMTTSMPLKSGESITVNVYIDQGYASLSSRTVVNVMIHCAGGAEYVMPIKLI